MAQTEDVFLRPTYDYAALSDRSIIYCRIAATTVSCILFSSYEISGSNFSYGSHEASMCLFLQFMIILVLWHSLTFFTNEAEHCSVLLFAVRL